MDARRKSIHAVNRLEPDRDEVDQDEKCGAKKESKYRRECDCSLQEETRRDWNMIGQNGVKDVPVREEENLPVAISPSQT